MSAEEQSKVIELPQAGEFTTQDAADIIRLCRSAPIPNMDQAEFRSELLRRFSVFVGETIGQELISGETNPGGTD